MKDVKIKCNSVEEADAVLQMIEDRYPEVRWYSGNKPTEWKPYNSNTKDDAKIYFDIDDDSISYSISTDEWHKDCDWTNATSAKRFLRKSNTAIHIYQRGRMVIAHESQTGREAVAKCSPSDTFNFHTGASIAMARLMSKVPATGVLNPDVRAEWTKLLGVKENPEAKFKVGDYVTLKEDVEADKWYGGLPLLSGPMHDFAYHKQMRVVGVDWQEEVGTYYYECKGDGRYTFHYSEEMLDKWAESKICEGDKVRVKKRCTGMRYDTYYEWVKEHITDPELLLAFEREDHVDTSLDFEVVKIAPHKLFSQKPIAYIKHKGDFRTICYLFDVEALEKV